MYAGFRPHVGRCCIQTHRDEEEGAAGGTASEEGEAILELLLQHASKFSRLGVQAANSAVEECEREVEQEKEVEPRREQNLRHKREEARPETNWKDWDKALQCSTLSSLIRVSETPVWPPLIQ